MASKKKAKGASNKRRKTPKGGPLVKKILVYMSTSTRALIDPARAAQVALRGALERALHDDRSTDDYFKNGKRRIEVSILVHGYQVDTGPELGATEFRYELGTGGINPTSLGGVASEFSFIPGDPSVLTPWIRARLQPGTGEIDSVALILWGHGQGIGTDLLLPRPADARPGIARPSFINIGGFGDRALAQAIEDAWLKPGLDDARAPVERLDLLVFDSCLMAGIELAYEFQGIARYLIASQSFVNTAPGGPPGLNLGAVAGAFVQPDAWPKAGVPPNVAGRRRDEVTGARLMEASTEIVNLIGDTRSGAQQLTLFQLDALEDAPREPDDDDTQTFLERLAAETNPQNREKLFCERVGRRASSGRFRVDGLMAMFTRVLREVSTIAAERERILFALRGASFTHARQFLDLRDVVRRIHRFSRHPLLQLLALALINELEPQADGFIVFHRAALPFRDKPRIGGVAVYCPWFAAQPTAGDEPAFDVVVDHDEYQFLAFNQASTWSSFALGNLYEATAPERRPRQTPYADHEPRHWPGCGGHWPYPPYPGGPYPPYPPYPYGFLGNKPDPALGPGDKPDAPLGPRDDNDYV